MPQTKDADTAVNPIESTEYAAAYKKAVFLLKKSKEDAGMLVPYTRIFTNRKEIKKDFLKIVPGDILGMCGNRFLWKRKQGQACSLYAKNDEEHLEFTKLCTLALPEEWVGVGHFIIDWPVTEENGGEYHLLITLYLFSVDCADFCELLARRGCNAAFMATIYFDKESAAVFYKFAKEKFKSLQ